MPGALRGPNGLAWARAQGLLKDSLVARTRESVYLGVVVDPEGRGRVCPADALSRHGADTALERAPLESAASYRTRLAAVWDVWGWAGTHYGYASALALTSAKVRGARFVTQHQWSPPDGQTALWSRFWVVVYTGALAWGRFTLGPWATWGELASPFTFLVWGAWAWGDGTWGTSATAAQLSELRAALAKWKNARDRVPELVVTDGELWGLPGRVWGAWVWGATVVRYTLPLVWGAWAWGATPRSAPRGPWHPYWGRSNFV